MRDINDLVQNVSKSFGERIIAEFCYDELEKAPTNLKLLFNLYFKLHLVSNIIKDLAWYIMHNFICLEGAKNI